MAFIDTILQEPSYGWRDAHGNLVVPSARQMFGEAFRRINIFKSRKNWLAFFGWFKVAIMLPFLGVFLFNYLSWPLVAFMIVYAMIIMSTHGTIWFHRYCTHKSYKFSSPIWRFITQNLVIKTLPEEVYVISHHVHHARSDQPGDPYNARAGLLYCMLADVNHQGIAKDLSEDGYRKVSAFMRDTGVQCHDYAGYQKWGSVATVGYTLRIWLLNWAFWYGAFYLMGGHALACAAFSGAVLWFIGVRAFNYTGHGSGEEKHQDGIDFDRRNLSINQMRPGLFSGEWHNNHHLYPGSARAGFLRHQLDLPWLYIYGLYRIGGVSTYQDSKARFMKKYIEGKKETKPEKTAEPVA